MPIIIKETQKFVSKEKPDKLLDYAISRIEIDDSRNKFTIYMKNDNSFNQLLIAIKRLHILAEKEVRFKVPFKTIMYKKLNAFAIEKNMKFALAYIKDCKAMSEKTYDMVIAALKEPVQAPEPIVSTMNLYN